MDMIRSISVAAALGLVAGVAPLHAQQGDRHQDDRRQSSAAEPQARPQPQRPQPQARPQPQEPRPQPQRQMQVEQPRPQPQVRVEQPRPQPQVRVEQPRPEPQVRVEQPQRQQPQGGQAQVWRQMQQQAEAPREMPREVAPQQAPVRRQPEPVQRPNAVYPEQPRRPVEPSVNTEARIRQEQERGERYRAELNDYTRRLAEQSAILQQQRRMAAYRFDQQYLANLREQEIRLQNLRAMDESYYSPYVYRYYRAGTYYQVSQYGAQALQRALNYGYQEGVMAGQADRQDGWAFNFQNSYAYQDANYGYDGLYVDQTDYNYYFRQGFERGYQDGYNGQFQYGMYQNGSYSMLGSLISSILGLQLIN